jgi:hypothetical protein
MASACPHWSGYDCSPDCLVFNPAAHHATEEERDGLAQILADISSVDKQTVRPPACRRCSALRALMILG